MQHDELNPENAAERSAAERPVSGPRLSATARGGERWASAARMTLLAAADAVALLVAGICAWLLWARPVHDQPIGLYGSVAPAIALVLLGYAQAGLYPGFGIGPVEILRRYTVVTSLAFMAFAAATFALKTPEIYSRVTVGIAAALSLGFVPTFRLGTLRVARRLGWWREPVVLVSDGKRQSMVSFLRASDSEGDFRLAGTLPVGTGHPDNLSDLGRAYRRAGVHLAFVQLEGGDLEDLLEPLRLLFPRVIVLREFGMLPVEGVQTRNLGGVLGLEYPNNLLRPQSRWVKRTLDLGLGTLSLILALPVILAAMLMVRLSSPGPALFFQLRNGKGGSTIRVPKIRTMHADAEERIEAYLADHPDRRAQWATSFKLRDDPRIIPRVGKLLRRFSIDEFPQLWSVVRGDMSLVGPRPFPQYHLVALSDQSRQLRSQVRPGITGLWQITARGVAGLEAQQAHDVYYIRNWSLWLDLYILARTGWVVLSGRGAY